MDEDMGDFIEVFTLLLCIFEIVCDFKKYFNIKKTGVKGEVIKETTKCSWLLKLGWGCVRIHVEIFMCLNFFFKILFIYFRERGREGEKHQCVKNTVIGCLSHDPN